MLHLCPQGAAILAEDFQGLLDDPGEDLAQLAAQFFGDLIQRFHPALELVPDRDQELAGEGGDHQPGIGLASWDGFEGQPRPGHAAGGGSSHCHPRR